MAAGIIQGTVTTTSGETIELSWLVDDTGTPTKWWNLGHPVNAAGASVAFGSGANGATVPRVALATDSPGVTALGQAAAAASLPVVIASDQWYVTTKVSANFTCPNNTSHTANDNISDNSTAGSVTKMSFTIAAGKGTITRIRVKKSDQTVATPTLRVWLWDTTFTVASGDDAAFSQPLTDSIGFADVAATTAGTDDAVGWTNCAIPFVAGTVFGLLQTLTTFTVGASEVFTVDIWYTPG